jgi:translation initiation factor 1
MTKPSDSPFAQLAALRDRLAAEAATSAPAPKPAESPTPPQRRLFAEKVVVRHVRKGHGGKTVTEISGVLPQALGEMCSEMKRALGCGARIDNGVVVLQGELVDRALAWLEKKGARKLVRGSG